MALRSETPPPPADQVPDAPPASRDPTLPQLKAEIDSGRTGDKNPVQDPGLSPLGTDDEAAGRPAGPERVAMARQAETTPRRSRAARMHTSHGSNRWVLPGYVAIVVAVAVVVGVAVILLR